MTIICRSAALAAIICSIPAAEAATFDLNDLQDLGDLTLVGDVSGIPTRDGFVLRMVRDEGSGSGSAYLTIPVVLGPGGVFSTRFQFRIIAPTGAATPDMSFVLAQSPEGLAAQIGKEPRSASDTGRLTVEYDTAQNEIAVQLGRARGRALGPARISGHPFGKGPCVAAPSDKGCLVDGDVWTTLISYDGTLLNVIVQEGDGPRYTVVFDYPVDLSAQLGGKAAYAGFTASSEGRSANMDLLGWEFVSFLTGHLDVKVLVDFDGHVLDAQLVAPSGFRRVDQSAIEYMRNYHFPAPLFNGKPSQVWKTMRYTFRLS